MKECQAKPNNLSYIPTGNVNFNAQVRNPHVA